MLLSKSTIFAICLHSNNIMKITEQTAQQIERFIKKTAQKFPSNDESSIITDIHIRVSHGCGEMVSFDDDDNEITRCVIDQWIDNKDENYYNHVATALHNILNKMSNIVDGLGILKPYSFVLENDEKEYVSELYLSDGDTVIIGGDIMENLNADLNSFLDNLLKKEC